MTAMLLLLAALVGIGRFVVLTWRQAAADRHRDVAELTLSDTGWIWETNARR